MSLLATSATRRFGGRAGLGAVVLAAGLLTACGSSETAEVDPEPEPTTDAVETETETGSDESEADDDGASDSSTKDPVPETDDAATDDAVTDDAATDDAATDDAATDDSAGSDGAVDQEAAVKASFEKYRQALLDSDGEAAANQVTTSTFEWYEKNLNDAITADAETILALPLGEGTSMVAARGNLGEGLLEVANGREFFISGVQNGLVGENVNALQMDSFDAVSDTEAFGLLAGQQLLRFELEDREWKLDAPFTVGKAFEAAPEEVVIGALTNGAATTRLEFYELLSLGLGATWDELSQPLS